MASGSGIGETFLASLVERVDPKLEPTQKLHKLKKDLKPGDHVLMTTPNTPRGQWPLGRVLEVYGGKDNHIRSVKLQVGSGQYLRPIVKVCPLEPE